MLEKKNKDVVNTDTIAEAKSIRILLPRMITQCSTPSRLEHLIHDTTTDFMLKVQVRLIL